MNSLTRTSLFAFLPLFAVAVPAAAQPAPPTVTVKGTVQGINAGGVLSVVSEEDKKPYLLGIDPRKSKVMVKGTAEPSYLRPGLLVRFNAVLNDKFEGQEEVKGVTLFSHYEAASYGVFPEDKSSFVAGRITGLKDGKLTVAAKDKQVVVSLASEFTVAVEANDFRIARVGDTLSARGKGVRPGMVAVDEMDITLTEPLKGPPEKTKRTRSQRKTGSKEKSSQGDADAAKTTEKDKAAAKANGEKPKR